MPTILVRKILALNLLVSTLAWSTGSTKPASNLDFVTQLLAILGEHLSLFGGQGRSQGLAETVAS